MSAPLLDIDGLGVTFNTPTGQVRAVRGLSLDVQQNEILGVVGESGCGKSVTFRALLGLTPKSATVTGRVRFEGADVAPDGELRTEAALIYQNPGAALNPVFTIGQQLRLVLEQSPTSSVNDEVMKDLLDRVGLPDPAGALAAYPHQFSGGMRQRAVVAMALASQPKLLIADEPTTALDVTTQAQVLDLLRSLRDTNHLTIVFISHDLAVIQQICDRVAVLYAGQLVEVGTVDDVMGDPKHPYTAALLQSIPSDEKLGTELMTIPGQVPDGRSHVEGCAFAPRCPHVRPECTEEVPGMRTASPRHAAACVLVGDER